MSTNKYMSYDNLVLYDESIKKYIDDNFAKQDEPIFTGDIIVDGEIKATNVPHTISETILCRIPAETIRDAINNNVKDITVDAFTHNPDVIVYANYGGAEYACITNEENYIEFFIANPFVTDGFACSFSNGVDADGNEDETKCRFNYRVLDAENITDLIVSQLEVSYIDSKYFDHDLTVINSISMNRRGNIGTYSTALGSACVAIGNSSFANGLACEATAPYATAVGKGSFATGEAALSTGLMTTAGREAFANGRYSEATGRGSLATGNSTKASGQYSVAEGQNTTASSSYCHASGLGSVAKATASHAEGNYTIAGSANQHVQGKYNIEDTAGTYAHIIGNGDSSTRSNAHTIDWNGNAWFAGDIYINSATGMNKDDGSKKLSTEEFVTSSVATKKDKDLIVTRKADNIKKVTYTVQEIQEAVNDGRTVRFLENVELFNLLEVNSDLGYATFFMLYMNENEKLQSQTIVIIGDEIYQDLNNVYDFATKEDLNNVINDITSEDIQSLFD